MDLFLLLLLVIFPFGCESKFWRRRWHSSVIAQDWLYIDGGEISHTQGDYTRENSTTLGLDLSKDWTNTSLTFIRPKISQISQARNSQALWFDNEKNVIYRFGEDNPRTEDNPPPPSDSIWGFTPDGNGGGTWTEVLGLVGKKPFPSDIHGTSSGMFVSDNNDAYYVGGFISDRTSPQASDTFTNTGLLRLNFETLTLTNSSELGWSVKSGALLNVPAYEILVAIGGGSQELGVGFNSIKIFDKKQHKWYEQIAEGDIPRPRSFFCAVGVHGKGHDSFEIIIHGGIVDYILGPTGVESDEVYVLSLPAFRWFRANYTSSSPREAHTCHATKNRQMILIGGTNPLYSRSGNMSGEPQDPWNQGIAVFDMTALRFKDSYQAKADPYESPYAIKEYYNSRDNKYPSSWTSFAVKEIFQDQNTPNATNNTTNSSTAPVNSTLTTQQSHSHLGHGALAGIIVGCLAASLLCAIIKIYMIQKRRKRKRKIDVFTASSQFELDGGGGDQEDPSELSTELVTRELTCERNDRAELFVPRTEETLVELR